MSVRDSAPGTPAPGTQGTSRTWWSKSAGASVVFFLAWSIAWEIVGWRTSANISSPSGIVVAAYHLVITENILLPALLETAKGLIVGYVIAVALGIPIGFAMGRSKVAEIVLEPYVTALYATPRIALIPLLVLWAGIGFELRVTVVVLSAIFPLILNVYRGSQQIDQDFVDVGRSCCATRLQMLRTVIVPASLPYLMAGLRLAMGRALIGIIVAEMAAALTGTGELIVTFGRYQQTDRLFVPIIVLGLLAIGIQRGMAQLERRATRWRATQEAP